MGKMPETCKTHHERSTKLELEKRIYETSKLLLQGVQRKGIILYAEKNQWGVSERQIDGYISSCYKIWRKENEKDKQADLDWHIEARKNLIKLCIEGKELTCARDVLADLTKLKGYYPVEKRALTAEINMEVITPDERRKRIEELEIKRLNYGDIE